MTKKTHVTKSGDTFEWEETDGFVRQWNDCTILFVNLKRKTHLIME